MSHLLPPALFMGARESDPDRVAIAGSVAVACGWCGEPTMFSPAIRAREKDHESVRYACLQCVRAHRLLEGTVLFPPDGAQLREREQAGGSEHWPLQEQWGRKLRSS